MQISVNQIQIFKTSNYLFVIFLLLLLLLLHTLKLFSPDSLFSNREQLKTLDAPSWRVQFAIRRLYQSKCFRISSWEFPDFFLIFLDFSLKTFRWENNWKLGMHQVGGSNLQSTSSIRTNVFGFFLDFFLIFLDFFLIFFGFLPDFFWIFSWFFLLFLPENF